jgi:hypothetical protein
VWSIHLANRGTCAGAYIALRHGGVAGCEAGHVARLPIWTDAFATLEGCTFKIIDPQVKHHGGRHDGHAHGADWQSVALFFEPTHGPRSGIQPKSAATTQYKAMDVLHRVARVQQVRLSCARRCTAYIDTGHASKWRKYDRTARGAAIVSMVSDQNALNGSECVVVHDF